MGHHSLLIGGVRQTLRQWGVTECVVQSANLMGGMLTFTIPVASLEDAEPVLALGDLVWLYDPAGNCVFIGRAREPRPVISAGAEALVYQCPCAGETALERTPYRQNWRFPADIPEEAIGPDTEMTEELVSLVTLFRDFATGVKVDLRDVLDDALEQANVQAFGEGELLDFFLDHVPEDIEPPEDEKRDLTVLDVVESCLRWIPYVSARWDYLAGYPTLRFSSAPTVDQETGDLLVPPTVSGTGFVSREVAVTELVDCSAEPRDERIIPKVTISYLIENRTVVDDQTIIWRSVERDVSEIANGAYGEVEITVPLRGVIWDGENYTEPEFRPPDGLARALHQAFGRIWWGFDVAKVGQEVDWSLKIGEGWSVTGIGARPAAALAVAQVISRDIMTGRTTVKCGPPSHLGYDELVDLLKPNRLRTVPSRAGNQQYGFGENEKKAADADGIVLNVPYNAVVTPIRFQAKPV